MKTAMWILQCYFRAGRRHRRRKQRQDEGEDESDTGAASDRSKQAKKGEWFDNIRWIWACFNLYIFRPPIFTSVT